MLKQFFAGACLALGVWLVQGSANVHAQTGPEQDGVERATEGARDTAGRASDAAQRTTNQARDAVNQGTQPEQSVRADVETSAREGAVRGDANARSQGVVDSNANVDARADADLDGRRQSDEAYERRGRTAEEGAYADEQYRDQGQYSDQQRYGSQQYGDGGQYRGTWQQGYRGAPAYNDGRVYTLQHDAHGREFICVSGRRVYFDDHSAGQQARPQDDRRGDYPPAPPEQGRYDDGRARQEYESNRPTLEDEQTRYDERGQMEQDRNAPPAPPEAAAEGETNVRGEASGAEAQLDSRQGAEVRQESAAAESNQRADIDSQLDRDQGAEAQVDSEFDESLNQSGTDASGNIDADVENPVNE